MKKAAVSLLVSLLILAMAGCSTSASGNAQTPSAKPTQVQTATPKAEPTPKDYEQIGFDLMGAESLGQLQLDMSETLLKGKIGNPDKKSKAVVWGSDSLEHATWTYSKLGLEIDMQKEPNSKAEYVVYSIFAKAPCTYATQRGIKIGDKKDAVLAAYKDEVNAEMTNDESIVLGSVFGGVIVSVKNGLVTEIFIGASAE